MTRERLTRDLKEIIKWPAGMTEPEAARRASLMARAALDLLSEAQELPQEEGGRAMTLREARCGVAYSDGAMLSARESSVAAKTLGSAQIYSNSEAGSGNPASGPLCDVGVA